MTVDEQRNAKRVRRPMERRRKRGQVVITVTEPGQIVIHQGTREDTIDAPPGSTIERPHVDAANAGKVGFA